MGVIDNLKHAFNTLSGNKDPTGYIGRGSYQRPDRSRMTNYKDKTILSTVCTRFAVDVSARKFKHIRVDEDNRVIDYIKSPINNAITMEANRDQTGAELIFDAVYSMCEEGVIGIMPTSTNADPRVTDSYNVYEMRVCKILEWFPDDIRVEVYDEYSGLMEKKIVPKKSIAICENPFASIMNSPNSTGQRLARKLSILDAIDEQTGSGKLDLIIQLPYSLKNPLKKEQASDRRKDIEMQLTGNKLGIAYIDATEKITQLNRPVENNLMKQIEYLTAQYLSQLGMTQGVLDGTASPSTMQNYQNRICNVLASAITNAMTRTFLSKTAKTQGQRIRSFYNILELIPIETFINMSGTLTASGILEAADIRDMLGKKPAPTPVETQEPEYVEPNEEYSEEEYNEI